MEVREDIVIGDFANRMRIVFLIHSDFFARHYVSLFVLRSGTRPSLYVYDSTNCLYVGQNTSSSGGGSFLSSPFDHRRFRR